MPADLRAVREVRARRGAAVASARRAGAVLAVVAAGCVAAWAIMVRMPGSSYAGPLPPLTDHERELEAALRRDVQRLAGDLGDRSLPAPGGLAGAADAIESARSPTRGTGSCASATRRSASRATTSRPRSRAAPGAARS